MFKYGRMQKGIPSRLVCAWLPWRMPRLHAHDLGFKSPLGWDFFLRSSHLIVI